MLVAISYINNGWLRRLVTYYMAWPHITSIHMAINTASQVNTYTLLPYTHTWLLLLVGLRCHGLLILPSATHFIIGHHHFNNVIAITHIVGLILVTIILPLSLPGHNTHTYVVITLLYITYIAIGYSWVTPHTLLLPLNATHNNNNTMAINWPHTRSLLIIHCSYC